MRKLHAPVAVVLGAAAVLGAAFVAGCGYGAHALYREDIRTVYVEFLDNQTYRRRLEVPLTQAVVDEIKLRTPLVFAPREEADSILRGRILSADVDTRVKSEEDALLLQDAVVEVSFSWEDRLTGRQIVPPAEVTERARVPRMVEEEGVFDTFTEQTTVFDIALREAARRIVERMEQSW
ncbi:MAG: LPS assembly lipoprotein LptE [Planctomycetota bacterium]